VKRLFAAGGHAIVLDVDEPTPRPGEVIVSTAFSAVSTGTETHIVRATAATDSPVDDQYPGPRPYGPKIHDRRVRWTSPAPRDQRPGYASLGYSLAGTVIEVGGDVADLAPGDRVACSGSQCAVHAERVAVPRSLTVRVPPEVSLDKAAFVTLGAIAMHALRRAACQFGETVVVYGLGTLGLLVVQIARAAGMYVFGLDLAPDRLQLARTLGAHWVLNPQAADPVAEVLERTDGFGADAVILAIATESSEPINIAFDLCRQRASVVGLGAFGMHIQRERMFAPDVSLHPAIAYGPGRYDPVYEEGNVDYPIGHVRWTENRNMAAFVRLLAEQKVDVGALAPDRVRLDDAPAAYERLMRSTDRPPTLLLTYY
jgi:threonine dehydrogenase-like Zn-dependent dehydrogenase